MSEDELMREIEFVQSELEAIRARIGSMDGDDDGYKDLADAYNKWVDRLIELQEKLEDVDKDVDKEKLSKEDIFRAVELGIKIGVPILALMSCVAVAKLSYASDKELTLCNGRVMGLSKDLFKILTMRV